MSWRILQITKPCKLSVKNSQLCYETLEDAQRLSIPLEDISVIIFEHKQILLSNALLARLAEQDTVVFCCGEQHLPEAVFYPFHNHFKYAEIAWEQVQASEPLKKRIWQEVIKAKINNQAACLAECGKENSGKLREIAKQVQSGDSKNAEAFAANLYWKSFFDDFSRNNESDIRNSALNYGYAIIRGAMARATVGAGLLPCFGVHHANKLNQFNLVDDLMEPIRPFIDYIVQGLNLKEVETLTTEIKNILVSVLTQNVLLNGEEMTLLKAMEIEAQSVVKTLKEKNIKMLKFPIFEKIPLFG